MTDITLQCEVAGKGKKGRQTREETRRREGEGQRDTSWASGMSAVRPFLADLL